MLNLISLAERVRDAPKLFSVEHAFAAAKLYLKARPGGSSLAVI